MKNLEVNKRIQKLIVIQMKKTWKVEKQQKKMEQKQEEFLEEIRENLMKEISFKKSQDDLLSPKQITGELNISRKTFDRWVIDGLLILQRNPGASIRVKRKDLEQYLKENGYDRLF